MGQKKHQERQTEIEKLKNADELHLRHLFVMVLEKYKSGLFGKNQVTFLREYLCDSFQSKFSPIRDDPATKATNILDKNSNDNTNGPSKSEYRGFCDSIIGSNGGKSSKKNFDVLYMQSEHLERKLASHKGQFQRNMATKRTDIGTSFIEMLSDKAPWLQEPMDNLQPIPLVEADFYKLLTVATVISLNLDTCTKQTETKDDVDKLCYRFLFDNAVPEALPDFSLKEIFDTLLQERTLGAVPTPGPEKFIPRKMDQVNDLDCLRILLSGIPSNYTLIPLDGVPESTDETYADETQILRNDAAQDKIRNLAGFYSRYKDSQNLGNLWRSMSAALRENLCAFDQFYRSVFANKDDESVKKEALESVRRGQFDDSEKIKKNFANMLSKCVRIEAICSAFWSGHDVKATIARADVFDCITAFVLIAVYCLKTRPGDADDAIPRERESFKSALIQKIKEVFFSDTQTRIQQIYNNVQQTNNDLQQLRSEINGKGIEAEGFKDLVALFELLRDTKQAVELIMVTVLENKKIPAEYKNLLIDYALSMINANTRVEESDRDKAKSRLLEPGLNSPIGGK